MNYSQLTLDYKYRHLAAAIYSREAEYFHYDFDRINFEYMVLSLPEGEFKDDINKRSFEPRVIGFISMWYILAL